MKRPPDNFGEYLRTLRKARGISAHALVGRLKDRRNPDFISDWERSARKVNKDVLQQLADALDLSDSERRQLFHLADVRNSPAEAKRLYTTGEDPGDNLVDGLLAVKRHDKPDGIDTPPARSDLTSALASSAGWVLTLWALRGGRDDFDFRSLGWPPDVYDLGLIDRRCHNADTPTRTISDPLLPHEIDLAARLGDHFMSQNLCSKAMAKAYRGWLFSTPDRVRECVTPLAYWSIQRGITDPIVTLRFLDPDDDDVFRVDSVSCDVVAAVNSRQVEFLISEARTDDARSRHEYVYIPDRVDFGPAIIGRLPGALPLDILAKPSLGREALVCNLQSVVDTIYNLSDAHAWSSATGLGRQNFQLNVPAHDNALDPAIDEQREELIDRLRKVERRIRRELARDAVAATDYHRVKSVSVSGQLFFGDRDARARPKKRSRSKPSASTKRSRPTTRKPKSAVKKASPRTKGKAKATAKKPPPGTKSAKEPRKKRTTKRTKGKATKKRKRK